VERPQYSTRLKRLGYLCDCLSGRVQKQQVVEVIWRNVNCGSRWMVQCYLTGDSNVSSHEGTLAPPGEYDWICASFGPLESITKMANGSVQPFLHILWQKVPIIYNGCPYPPELPLAIGDLYLSCNTWCFGTMWAYNANSTLIGSAVFSPMTAECRYTLQWFACFPLKIAPSHVDIWTSCNTWFTGPTGVWNTNGNLIV